MIVERMTAAHEPAGRALDGEQLTALQRAADAVFVDPALIEYAVKLSNATRDLGSVGLGDLAPYVTYGASPRASINLILAGRALALVRGREYALPQDLQEIAHDVLRHRLVLSYQALGDGIGADAVVDRVLAAVPVPELALRERMATGARDRDAADGGPALSARRRRSSSCTGSSGRWSGASTASCRGTTARSFAARASTSSTSGSTSPGTTFGTSTGT